MVSLLCGFACVTSNCDFVKMTFYKVSKRMAFHLCESEYDSSGHRFVKTTCYKLYITKASYQYDYAVRMCTFRLPFCVKTLPQKVHVFCFSLVCVVCMCLIR